MKKYFVRLKRVVCFIQFYRLQQNKVNGNINIIIMNTFFMQYLYMAASCNTKNINQIWKTVKSAEDFIGENRKQSLFGMWNM